MLFVSDLPLNTEAEIIWIRPDIQLRLAGSPLRYHAKITKVANGRVICNGNGFIIDGLEQSIGIKIVEKEKK